MITNLGPITLNDCLVELGYSSGIEMEIGVLCDDLDNYSTGAGHSADSAFNLGGFTGGNVWHFLRIVSATDHSTYVTVRINNEAMVDAFTGTLYYEIHNASHDILSQGSQSVTSINPGSYADYDLPYSTGTPDHVHWRWAVALGWNETGVSV